MSIPSLSGPRGRNGRIRWASVPSYPGYLDSSDGRILGKRGGELKQQNDEGYYRVMVAVRGRGRYIERKFVRVNRMVCEAFHGKAPSPFHDAAHENGNSLGNHYTNLKWRTRAENVANPMTIRRMVQAWTRKAVEA